MDNLTLKTYLKEKLKNPEFKKEWGRSETQYQITRQFILARLEKNFSQRKLAQKAKTTQTVISRIENLSVRPSLEILERIAQALGKELEVNLVTP